MKQENRREKNGRREEQSMVDKEGSHFLTQKKHTLILTNVALVNLLKH